MQIAPPYIHLPFLNSYCAVLDTLVFTFRCRKLPKGLKEWQAFNDLKKKIEDFNMLCPLLERMLDKSMKDRHWKRIEDLTKWKFDVQSEGFILRNVMEAPLLTNIEDIEVALTPSLWVSLPRSNLAVHWCCLFLALYRALPPK